MRAECKNCKGKGHVLQALWIIFPLVGWALAALETNNKNGVTREVCEHCNGTGYVKING